MSRTVSSALLSLTLLAPLGAQAQQPPLFGDWGNPAWSRYFKAIETRLIGPTPSNTDLAMLLPTPTNADWSSNNQTRRLVAMNGWGEAMPPLQWTYLRNSSKRVSDGYKYFLNAAMLQRIGQGTASEDLKNATRRALDELEFARTDYKASVDQADAAYENYASVTPKPQRLTKAQFFKQQAYDIQIRTKDRALKEAAGTFDIISNGLNDPDIALLKDAQIRLSNPNQKIRLPASNELINDPDRWQEYYITTIDKSMNNFSNDYKPQTQEINEAQSSSQYFETHWKVNVSVSFLGLFRAGGASAEQLTREKHVRTNTTNIQIGFENLDVFPITRGEWFSQNVIDKFGPTLKPSEFNAVFGPGGQLEVVPMNLLVGKGMSFTVFADSQSLDYLYEHFHAAADAGIMIGWWKLGGSGEYSTTKENIEVRKFSDRITFSDLSGRPQVIAIAAKHMAGGMKPAAAAARLLSAEQMTRGLRNIEAIWAAEQGAKALQDFAQPTLMQNLRLQLR